VQQMMVILYTTLSFLLPASADLFFGNYSYYAEEVWHTYVTMHLHML